VAENLIDERIGESRFNFTKGLLKMPQGKITHFDATKGFGFIQPEGAEGRDDNVFFHRSQSPQWEALASGDRVEYDLVPSRKDPKETVGSNVRLRDDAERSDSGLERYLDPTN
jgi:cold shock CspA family protein